jgi:CheY-like chemotaxis protein
MAQRSILCIDPDAATVADIRNALQPHGFRVESIPNGDQAMEWARLNGPSMIVLAVEPRKVGYAICNKLKRSPTLRETPLLLISSEETLATFHQHKKLKSRADEYLLKPLDLNEVIGIVDRLVGLSAEQAESDLGSAEEIELADDEIAEVSLDDDDAIIEDDEAFLESPSPSPTLVPGDSTTRPNGAIPEESTSLQMLGDLSRPVTLDPGAPSPFTTPFGDSPFAGAGGFDAPSFGEDTEASFTTRREERDPANGGPSGESRPSGAPGRPEAAAGSAELVNMSSFWDEEELPAKMPWEGTHPSISAAELSESSAYVSQELTAPPGSGGSPGGLGYGAGAGPGRSGPTASAGASGSGGYGVGPGSGAHPTLLPTGAGARSGPTGHALSGNRGLQGPPDDGDLPSLGEGIPPLPEEVIYDDRSATELAARDQRIAELQARVEVIDGQRASASTRATELQSRIESLEAERQTLRRELDEQRDRMTQAASQGAFSKERDLLSLREVINKKEKDILDLRDALDAKERQILDHKDKIRENERARRDLEERMLGFERSLFVANEKTAELLQDKDKSVERERGLKARLDDAHEELRKGQDEIEALRKRIGQEIERGRAEVERTRVELEGKLLEAGEHHHQQMTSATDDWNAKQQAAEAAHLSELARSDAAHRQEIDGLQRRLADESAAATERLQTEMSKLRREHEKTVLSLKEEQALQLASERQAYESQADAKHRAYREEIIALRRRHEEELAAAEDRRQRDILEQEQRRVGELEQAESRRRGELQARDEEHHSRVTEIERRHLIEKTESAERHRLEYDQAVGRAVRAEGELIARSQEIEQAYRRLAGFEADLDAARVELGDRELKLTQNRDRIGELEGKLSDYEDQIVRAYQRLRADEKTGEKIRRALAVALALMDERGASGQQATALKTVGSGEEAEKS